MSDAPKTCPLCRCHAGFLPGGRGRDFYHCHGCDLIFVPVCQHPTPEEARTRYLLHDNTMANPGYVRMFESVLGLLERFCPSVESLLDYGCGPGPVLVELLRRRGYRAVGYDPFFAPDTDLTGPFDAVVSTETFEHFSDPGREMKRLVRLIRPGGYLAVMTLFHPGPDGLADWWYIRDTTHVAFYSTATLDWICSAHGLTTVYRDDRNFAIMRRRMNAP